LSDRSAYHGKRLAPASRLVGKAMASGNRSAIEWTVSRLDIGESDNVLEVGFGPGVGIECAARRAPGGRVFGIDRSPTMVDVARRRNVRAIVEGRVDLREADAAHLPYASLSFDKVFSVHCIYFWSDPLATLEELRRVLAPGGRIAITVLPKTRWLETKTKPPEHLFIDGQKRVEQREAVEAGFFFLAEVQEAQWPEQHGLDRVPGLLRLRHFVEQARRHELELRGRIELGHEVVVVGVEPLGHFQRESAFGVVAAVVVYVAGFAFHAARHREVTRKFGFAAMKAEARRLAAEQLDMVGHVVVVCKVADRHEVESRIALGLPVARAQFFADRFERGAIDLAAPVLFEGELEFPVGAHARKAEGVGTGGHFR